ncbi:class I SAM-dependent RNA methyltransferase [Alkalilacustris brevis]|uniref:class I SAM-dependent RNA methyltransferase n=1 Tax=Alkalilacustris brevis TaxID=2026338 RepID=UPI000E0D3282|nr:class I SAM-dependent RNA methyltransferase [Alkalilacustris brevis]
MSAPDTHRDPAEGVRIARLGHRGDGIAADGTLAARTLPGEVVAGACENGRIASPRILYPSPDRVRPPCVHYRQCGGCALQHASDGFVAQWKQDIVRNALAAQGLEASFGPMHSSPPCSRRRATLTGRRLKRGPVVGFHARASDVVTPIPDCLLLHPDLMAVLPALEGITASAASRKGALSFTVTASEAGVDLAITGGPVLDGALRARLGALSAQHRLARLSWDGEVLLQHAPPFQRFGAARVVPPPGAFLQATAEGEAALLAAVEDATPGARRIADLFAGCGTFALPLAARAEVHAVEGDAAMTAALDAGWRQAQGLRRVTTEARDLFRRPLTAGELARFDAVVIDPPRAGAEAQIAELARSTVPVIAYVSCNPASFARDARALVAAGYRLEWVRVVDQFRWSPHVELAAQLVRRHIPRE